MTKPAVPFEKSLTRQLDLNLLELFDTVYKAGSLTAAGERLGLSQPAVSYGLGRLREMYGDPLFLRVQRGVVPTAFAQGLAGTVDTALRMLRGTLNKPTFEPAVAQRVFRVVMSDIGERYFLPRLSAAMQAHSPGVSIQTLSLGSQEMAEGLAAGSIDLAIGFIPSLDKQFHQQVLFVERFVYLMRKGHEALRGPLTLRRMQQLRHIVGGPPGMHHRTVVEKVLLSPQVRAQIVLRPQNFLAIGPIVAESDLVALVPSNLAQVLTRTLEVKTARAPVEVPPFNISLYWHARMDHDPASTWLRAAFTQLFAETADPTGAASR